VWFRGNWLHGDVEVRWRAGVLLVAVRLCTSTRIHMCLHDDGGLCMLATVDAIRRDNRDGGNAWRVKERFHAVRVERI